jgi:hypothetical protein
MLCLAWPDPIPSLLTLIFNVFSYDLDWSAVCCKQTKTS